MRKQCCYSKAGVVTKAVLLFKSGSGYESSTSFQKLALFTKAVLLPKSATSLRKQPCNLKGGMFAKTMLLFESGGGYESSTSIQKWHKFTKEASLPKSGTSLRKQYFFPKAALFTKPVLLPKSATSLRKRHLSPKAAQVYERKTSPPIHSFRKPCPLFHSSLLSHIKFKKQHVPVLNNIFFAFLAVLAGSLNFCFAAIFS